MLDDYLDIFTPGFDAPRTSGHGTDVIKLLVG
jgi:hypothetical protein